MKMDSPWQNGGFGSVLQQDNYPDRSLYSLFYILVGNRQMLCRHYTMFMLFPCNDNHKSTVKEFNMVKEKLYSATHSAIAAEIPEGPNQPRVVYRNCGTDFLLIEYGEVRLDINIRVRVHALEEAVSLMRIDGIIDMTSAARSLLIHFDGLTLSHAKLLEILKSVEQSLTASIPDKIPSRVMHMPIAFRDKSVKESIEKYMAVFRSEAPYLPCNVEFVARANGLKDAQEVISNFLGSPFLVVGLGDVYMGAPNATALDPRLRMIVPKYNPARIWTAEGVVALGGSTMSIYPLDSPGGYQLMGRTVQTWDTFQRNKAFENPWLFRNFDKLQWHRVDEEELDDIRSAFEANTYEFKIEDDVFDVVAYNKFLDDVKDEVDAVQKKRLAAIDAAMVGY